MRSMVEGACGAVASREADAPSTALLRSAVPLPRFAGQDEERVATRVCYFTIAGLKVEVSKEHRP
jgi:hypothetical protein